MSKLAEIIDKLLRQTGPHFDPRPYPHGKPGQLVSRLSKEDREILSTATVKDFNHRFLHYDPNKRKGRFNKRKVK